MDILKASTEAEARALERKAFAWAMANQRSSGAQFSEIFTDGTNFGIAVDPSVMAAFTAAETGETVTKDKEGKDKDKSFSKVQSVETKVKKKDGTTTGTWEIVPAPEPVMPKKP